MHQLTRPGARTLSVDHGVVVVGDPRCDPEGLRIGDEATTRRRAGRAEG